MLGECLMQHCWADSVLRRPPDIVLLVLLQANFQGHVPNPQYRRGQPFGAATAAVAPLRNTRLQLRAQKQDAKVPYLLAPHASSCCSYSHALHLALLCVLSTEQQQCVWDFGPSGARSSTSLPCPLAPTCMPTCKLLPPHARCRAQGP